MHMPRRLQMLVGALYEVCHSLLCVGIAGVDAEV
jgi:hypothetical protein